MKLGKIAWLILGIGILVIALGSLYTVYRGQVQDQEKVNNSLSLAQVTLSKLATERANLESTLTEIENKLTQATSRLKPAKAAFPTSMESIEVDEQLFRIAKDWGLEVISLTASKPDDEKVKVEVGDTEVGDVTYFVTSFTIAVKGEVSDILDFINTIVTRDDFNTATIEMVNIKVPEPPTEEEEAEKPSATIQLVIYGYKGG